MAEYKTVLSFGVTKLPCRKIRANARALHNPSAGEDGRNGRSFRGRSHPISGREICQSISGPAHKLPSSESCPTHRPSFPCITVATPEIVRRGAMSSHPCSRTGDKAAMARISLPLGLGGCSLGPPCSRQDCWLRDGTRIRGKIFKCGLERPADGGRKLAGRVKSSTSGRSARGTIATR
jgi:hypothetical protein